MHDACVRVINCSAVASSTGVSQLVADHGGFCHSKVVINTNISPRWLVLDACPFWGGHRVITHHRMVIVRSIYVLVGANIPSHLPAETMYTYAIPCPTCMHTT